MLNLVILMPNLVIRMLNLVILMLNLVILMPNLVTLMLSLVILLLYLVMRIIVVGSDCAVVLWCNGAVVQWTGLSMQPSANRWNLCRNTPEDLLAAWVMCRGPVVRWCSGAMDRAFYATLCKSMESMQKHTRRSTGRLGQRLLADNIYNAHFQLFVFKPLFVSSC